MTEPKIKDAIKNNAPSKTIGGQAVMEGVMMRGKKMYAMAVRKPDGEIQLVTQTLSPISNKYPVLKLPIVRGVVSFISSMYLGMKTLMQSAEIATSEDLANSEPQSKFEAFLEKKFGDKLTDYIIYFSVFLSLLITVVLFMFLPVWISSFMLKFIGERTWLLGIVEGILKMTIFIGYLSLMSRSKDIRRVFEYHGAEHKTINCLEHNEPLTVENVKSHSRLHKRCGTSFLFIVLFISMAVFIFVKSRVFLVRFGLRLLLVPIIAGVSFEIIKWAGSSNSALVGIISYPGLMIQKLTTREPDDGQIEAAIAATQEVLRNEPE